MAIVTESFTANGTQKTFTVGNDILSDSHCRIHFYYDSGTGLADHEVVSSEWDLLGKSTVVFNTAPTNLYIVKITTSSDGSGLDAAPSEISDVASNIAAILNVNSIDAEIVTVSGISSDVTTVALNDAHVTTVATNIANINIVVAIDSDVTAVALNNSDISAVNANKVNIDAVAANEVNINAVNTNKTNIDAVATNESNITTVSTNTANINTVAGIDADVTTVSTNNANVTVVATNIANVNTVATDIVSVTSIADNMTDVTYFADIYQGAKAVAPTLRNDGSALAAGDLYFNTVGNAMFVYDGSVWGETGSAINGVEKSEEFIATGGQTLFTLASGYDVGFVNVFREGMLLGESEYTADNGSTVTLNVACIAGDIVKVQAFGAFTLANTYTIAQTDA